MYEDEIPVGKAKDLRGQKFGRWTVLYRIKSYCKTPMWKCKCECGTERGVLANSLGKDSWSCGCAKVDRIREIGKARLKDLTGEKFGQLTVIQRIDNKNERVYWLCKCSCGKEIEVRGGNLTSGNTTSCGYCNHPNKAIDLIGKKFCKLTVISKADKKASGNIHWNCLCECGNLVIVNGAKLRNGHTKSCGCLNSYGEKYISELFRFNKIPYEQQKSFDTCKFNDTNCKARFDFFVNKKYLIEFDGSQHFFARDSHWNTKENFQKVKEHDAYKNQWCRENNIPLIRIPYWKLNTLCIEDLMLETTKFRVV